MPYQIEKYTDSKFLDWSIFAYPIEKYTDSEFPDWSIFAITNRKVHRLRISELISICYIESKDTQTQNFGTYLYLLYTIKRYIDSKFRDDLYLLYTIERYTDSEFRHWSIFAIYNQKVHRLRISELISICYIQSKDTQNFGTDLYLLFTIERYTDSEFRDLFIFVRNQSIVKLWSFEINRNSHMFKHFYYMITLGLFFYPHFQVIEI